MGSFSDLLAKSGDLIDFSAPFPYYPLVPKDQVDNRVFRDWIAACGERDERDRKLIFEACARDLLFFINAFLWIKQESPVPDDLLFLTWPRQDEYCELLQQTRAAVDADPTGTVRGDVLSDKPREVGWTWLDLAEDLQIARFKQGATVLVGSRVEYDVDRPGASKTLFWKLDYYIERLPRWFMPDRYWSGRDGWPYPNKTFRSNLKLAIPGFGTILGSATHENFGRSGRYYKMSLDEFAHVDRGQFGMGDKIWAATTNTCRLRRAFSTPFGRVNKFATLRFSETLPTFTCRWHDDPAKMHGAYQLTEDVPIGPITVKAGEWWSPWAEATRKAYDNDALFAQEILLSYEGVGRSFYDKMLPDVKHLQVKQPVWRGNILLKNEPRGPRALSFEEHPQGFVQSWEPIPSDRIWPTGLYCMGIDVASGSSDQDGRGASNSVVAVGRVEGRKVVKVLQYTTHGLMAHLFARVVSAIGWCFRGPAGFPALACWERNGPGEIMGHVLTRDYGYTNYYVEKNSRSQTVPGFQMQTFRKSDGELAGSKVNVFTEHKIWIATGDYQEPSYDTYREMEQYVYTDDAGAQHQRCAASLDPSEGRANHGDSVIATVLMIWMAKKLRDEQSEASVVVEPPAFSVAWAQKRRKHELAEVWR